MSRWAAAIRSGRCRYGWMASRSMHRGLPEAGRTGCKTLRSGCRAAAELYARSALRRGCSSTTCADMLMDQCWQRGFRKGLLEKKNFQSVVVSAAKLHVLQFWGGDYQFTGVRDQF